MNINEIVQIPYSTAPKFTRCGGVEFKTYTQDAYEQRLIEYNTLLGDMSFESSLAEETKLVKKTSMAINLVDEPFIDIIDMGLEIPDDVIIMHKGKVEAAFVAMASNWNPKSVNGKTLAEVHEPVADNEALVRASDGIWRSMTSGNSFHRHVWGISPLKGLSNHPRHWPESFEVKSLQDLYFRIEHERTLTVDKDTAAFFINVEVLPLQVVFDMHENNKNTTETLKNIDSSSGLSSSAFTKQSYDFSISPTSR